MDRAQKRETVEDLGQIFTESGSVVVARYTGLTVAQLTELRRRMRAAGAKFQVIKNRLAKIALENSDRRPAAGMFVEPTGIAYGSDLVAPAKVAAQYAKENDKFVIVGGLVGRTLMDEEGVKALARIPSLNELRAMLLGVLQAPATKLARTLNEPASSLARVLDARRRQQEEAGTAQELAPTQANGT